MGMDEWKRANGVLVLYISHYNSGLSTLRAQDGLSVLYNMNYGLQPDRYIAVDTTYGYQ